ncbi:hypothetical protein BLOT_002323 [Blomia tropicalis]|nr:hypothetical protein BLOT_002323 [Blomia tropicalis]
MNAQTIKLESDSPFSPVPNSTMFGSNQSQSSQQQQQQPSSLIKYETNDQLTMFDQSGNGQSAFSIDISSSSSANSMQPRNVKQEVRNFVNNRNQQHQQQQQQSAQMVQQQQQMQSVATSSSPAQQQVSNSLVSNQSSSSVMDNQIDFLDFEFDMNDFGDMTDTGPGPTGSTPPPMTLGNILGGGNGPSMMSNNQQGGQSLSRTNSMENQKPEQNQQSLLQSLVLDDFFDEDGVDATATS